LKVGNVAQIRVHGEEDPIPAKVTLVSPALDPGSTTIEVWVQSNKASPALKPGMTAQIQITARSVKDALTVPASALYKNDEGADYVLLAGSDNHAAIKNVQVGIRTKDRVQILDGLAANDKVITTGGYALPDKTQIKIEAAPSVEKEKASSSSESPAAGKG